jgi:hypothetical protein
MMRRMLGLVLTAGLLPAAAVASLPVYSTSFEESTFVVDQTLGGKGGWVVSANTATVRSGSGAQGTSKFVELGPGAQIDRSFTDIAGDLSGQSKVWVEGYFKGQGSSTALADATYPPDAASAIVHFTSGASGIEFLNGDKNGGAGTPVASGVVINSNNWYRVTIQLNFTNSEWNVWIDNLKENTTPLGFKSAGVTTLNGFRSLAQNTAFFDAFRVVLPLIGDANGDALLDGADLTATALSIAGSPGAPTDVIVKNNADVDGNGTINGSDLSALATLISTP